MCWYSLVSKIFISQISSVSYTHLNQQKKGVNAGKWFARAVSDETFDLAKLAEHMSKHNSPYSSGVIKGVLTDMVDCIKELLLDGKSVKIDDLAIFGVGIRSKAAEKMCIRDR